jgi:NAD(P)-dependent dehydrogenase (short-subunit alcohol dehydrogenase family)
LELLPLASEARAISLDLLAPDSPRQAVDEVSRAWGGLDILITNAGAAAQGGFLELEDEVWPTGFGLKMFANLRVIKHCLAFAERFLRAPDHDRGRNSADSASSTFAGFRS